MESSDSDQNNVTPLKKMHLQFSIYSHENEDFFMIAVHKNAEKCLSDFYM